MKRILITGASGFVGRHLAQFLATVEDAEIIGLSSRQRAPLDEGRLLVCDLRDANLTRRVIQRYGPDVIFHLAGQAWVPRAFADPVGTLTHNAIGQLNLFEACRTAEIDPIIVVIGSAEVYGRVRPDEIPITEDQPFRPVNPYAVSKAAQDLYAWQYFASYGLKTVRVRPFNHAGPGQSDQFVVSSFARQIAEAEAGTADPVLLVGNLDAIRDFTDVRDVVRAYWMLADERFAGDVYNVSSDRGVRIGDMLNALLALASCEITVRFDPNRMRPSDVPEIRGSNRKLTEATGWEPQITIETTVRDVLNEWRLRV